MFEMDISDPPPNNGMNLTCSSLRSPQSGYADR
jgi:hypothetical protein